MCLTSTWAHERIGLHESSVPPFHSCKGAKGKPAEQAEADVSAAKSVVAEGEGVENVNGNALVLSGPERKHHKVRTLSATNPVFVCRRPYTCNPAGRPTKLPNSLGPHARPLRWHASRQASQHS